MDPRQREAVAAQVSFSRQLSAFLIGKAASIGINLVYSPLSMHSLLSYLAFEASGPTRQQLLDILENPAPHLVSPLGSKIFLRDGHASGGPRLHYLGGVWFDEMYNMKHSNIVFAGAMYDLCVHPLPLRSVPEDCRNLINKWVEEETAGLIKTLFLPKSITGDARLVLGNVIRFKGKWDANFRPWTRKDNFRLLNGNLVKSLFIVSAQAQFISTYDGFKVLKLPYEQGSDWRKFSFYIFLPNTLNGFLDLWIKLRTQSDFLNNHIPERRVPVGNFRIPKFEISMAFTFAQYLTELKVDLPFKRTGDFSLMVDSSDASDYYVSEIAHACSVEVNEEGTEPTAASWAAMQAGSSMPITAIDFEADHPFVFFIREDTSGAVFFAGHLLNPLLE